MRSKSKGRYDGPGWTPFILAATLGLAAWIVIGAVVIHFVVKWW